MKEDIEYNFEYRYEMGDSQDPPEYWIEITDMPWAKNLATVAEILQKVDYCSD